MRIRVIGVGSPHGDDAAGLAVVEALRLDPLPPGVTLETCERPGPELAVALSEADAVVLVDAMRSGRPPGTVEELDPERLSAAAPLSTHGFGVAEALALARALGRPLPPIVLLGIEAGARRRDAPSPAVDRGVARARRKVLATLSRLRT